MRALSSHKISTGTIKKVETKKTILTKFAMKYLSC